MITIPTLPASPVLLTLMSIHVLLTLIIIILFYSADLVSTSILNVSRQPRGDQALRPCIGTAEFTLISGTDNLHGMYSPKETLSVLCSRLLNLFIVKAQCNSVHDTRVLLVGVVGGNGQRV